MSQSVDSKGAAQRRAQLAALLEERAALESHPLSESQRALWFLNELHPGSPLYNVPLAYRLEGVLDRSALLAACQRVVMRHESLRCVFRRVRGEPRQMILDEVELAMPSFDLRDLGDPSDQATSGPLDSLEPALADRLREQARRPFDFERGPLLRLELLELALHDHVLLITLHHIICDAWSVRVLLEELGHYYAIATGHDTEEPAELEIQHIDYLEWQAGVLTPEVVEEHLDYWRNSLAPVLPPLELPSERERPAEQSHAGATTRFEVADSLRGKLEQLARTRGMGLSNVLLAAFYVLLHRYTRSRRMNVGVLVANRSRPELLSMIGLLSNALVLRADLADDPSFESFLERTQRQLLSALAHQELPFDRLVNALRPQRELSQNPLFQVAFSYREDEVESLALPGLAVRSVDTFTDTAKFDLTLSVAHGPGDLRGWFEYATDLFDASFIENLMRHYTALLESSVANPSQALSELQLTSRDELRCLGEYARGPPADYQASGLAHEQFEEQARLRPDALAIVYRDQSLTYRALDAAADDLARHLLRQGVVVDSRVGLCLASSSDLVVGMLAILKAGGAFVPLDPDYPRKRLRAIIGDAGIEIVICQQHLSGKLADVGLNLLLIDKEMIAKGAEAPLPRSGVRPGQLAYTMFTSGSTGRPKGVMLSHANLMSFLLSCERSLRLARGRTWLALSNPCFDITLFDLLWVLTRGDSVVIADKFGSTQSEQALPSVMERYTINHLACTPSFWNVLLADPKSAAKLGELDAVLLGGEAVSEALANQVSQIVPGDVYNLYGPTECSVFTLFHQLNGDKGAIPVGRPTPNAQIYLVDAHLNLCPPGIPGEILIGGPAVGRGYVGEPGLTAERFIPDAFGSEPGGRLYRTGDRARWNRFGQLVVLGRLDDQVKIRGFRIELGEIEVVLGEHPEILQACVTVIRDSAGQGRLVAHCVTRANSKLNPHALRVDLEERLPSYMVPSAFVFPDSLPLGISGKVDRRALKVPEQFERVDSVPYRAASSELEVKIAQIWCDLLKLKRVGSDDNFFDLGGSSLLIVSLRDRLERVLDCELQLVEMFRFPTVSALASAIDARTRSTGGSDRASAKTNPSTTMAKIRARATRRIAQRRRGEQP